MKESTRAFIGRVVRTTGVTFFLVSFLFIGIYALTGRGGPKWDFFQFFTYLFIKLYACVFPFSLSLGFINRIFEWKGKSRAFLRLAHFLLAFVAYFVFMDLAFNVFNFSFGFYEGQTEVGTLIRMTLPFFVLYPIVVWVNKLGKAIFFPKDQEAYRSILD